MKRLSNHLLTLPNSKFDGMKKKGSSRRENSTSSNYVEEDHYDYSGYLHLQLHQLGRKTSS